MRPRYGHEPHVEPCPLITGNQRPPARTGAPRPRAGLDAAGVPRDLRAKEDRQDVLGTALLRRKGALLRGEWTLRRHDGRQPAGVRRRDGRRLSRRREAGRPGLVARSVPRPGARARSPEVEAEMGRVLRRAAVARHPQVGMPGGARALLEQLVLEAPEHHPHRVWLGRVVPTSCSRIGGSA